MSTFPIARLDSMKNRKTSERNFGFFPRFLPQICVLISKFPEHGHGPALSQTKNTPAAYVVLQINRLDNVRRSAFVGIFGTSRRYVQVC